MATKSSFLSQTLQSITTTKIREHDKRLKTFEARKTKILKNADAAQDERGRLGVLLSGFHDLSSSNKGIWYVEDDRKRSFQNISRFLEQSGCDPSVSSTLLRQFEKNLRQKFDQESERFHFADLYYRLLTEWTDAKSEPLEASEHKEDDLEGSFEHVQKYTLQQLKDKFSNVVFTPLETNEVDIDAYLSSLFEDDYARGILMAIRHKVALYGELLDELVSPFNPDVIKECIKALLLNDLLNDDAKTTLDEFSTNDVVLDEIADVLNLRFSDIKNWSWEADEGMYYEPRRQPNGKYRIMMDQDILQAIFLHYIAVLWCAQLKDIFSPLPADEKFWKGAPKMSEDERARHKYFTNDTLDPQAGIESHQMKAFRETFFLSSLPGSPTESSNPYDEDSNGEDETKTGLGIRQKLLRQIATEVIIRRSLYGEVAVVQSDLQWYATGLPHSTLFAVLRFWGLPENWITFFKKFAEAPLRMDAEPGKDVRIRKRGIPITDSFEKLFGECVLFGMDVAVNRLSGMTLFRFHDDLFLTGEPSTCAHAWETIEGFVKVLGLSINTSKTGSVYISDGNKDSNIASKFPDGPVCMGMLQLADNGDWTIDQKQVSAHVRQLKKQLGQSSSIISWIQTWNICMGKFFRNIFGTPANCFGQAHVNAILQTHTNIQRELFESHNGSVTHYLREQIRNRFNVDDVPDAFFFLPEEFGGLGLQNPFIPFFVLKDQLMKDPFTRITEFRQEEQKAYKDAQEAYDNYDQSQRQNRLHDIFDHRFKDNYPLVSASFPSFETYTSHRIVYSPRLLFAYVDLMRQPAVQNIQLANEIRPWFEDLSHSHLISWSALSSENKWNMILYAEELKGRFGSLSIVDRNLLPSGVMKMVRGRKGVWQLIIWE
ncbi:hypothetical protein P280DRAFT_457319 [Massarina eburnea CBS 473.64]|uniref:Reverse transcriptase domain-containing protein n=1 Tax=Massarina eburnea CBS 473.64 TaxID=1395130 RepID=A0A6A6RQM1_9PLEO|nr:hypothetical protein P280DRAFT_457319 [Massarina eburnea CBS 473.64]